MRHHKAAASRVFRFTKVGNVVTSPTDIENAAASALAGAPDGATFVTHHERGGGVQHFYVTDDQPGQEGVAFSIARAMAAHSTEVDEVPDLISAGGFAKLVFRRGTRPLSDTQAGADFTALSRIVGDMLKPGEWVGMSVRKPNQHLEMKRQSRWLDHHGIRTHHSRKSGAVVVALYAGGEDTARARELAERVAAGIPGFGLSVRGVGITPFRSVRGWLAAAAGSGAVLAAALSIPGLGVLPLGPFGNVTGTAVVLTVAALVGAVASWKRLLPSEYRTVIGNLVWGRVPTAEHRLTPPRKPRHQSERRDKDGNVHTVPEFDGDYPLAPSAFLVGPHLPVELVAPHSSASGGASTALRHAPAELLEPVGPRLGFNMDRMVHLSDEDAWAGVAVVGQAGSGKSALLEQLWGAASRKRMMLAPHTPGSGSGHALIAFDTKGDGLASVQYATWLRHNGDQGILIHALDPQDTAAGIDFFPTLPGQTPTMWARNVASAMRYIWGEDSIGAESFDTLTRILAAAKVITPDMAARVQLQKLNPASSPFAYADILLGNKGDELAVELAATVTEAAANPATSTPDLVEVAGDLAPLYGPGRTPAQRAALQKAPRTKVGALMAAESWWSRPRKHTWEQLLSGHAAVIINTGVGPSGLMPDEKLREDLSGLALYTLAEQIKRTCIGWFEAGQTVSVYADEVKHLANTSPAVINWMRHDARANGVRAFFATQTPETLHREVRQTLLGLGTLILYAQSDEEAARKVVADLSLSGTPWDVSDIVNLERFHAIVRTTFRGRRLDPFTIRVPDYRSMREAGTWQSLEGVAA